MFAKSLKEVIAERALVEWLLWMLCNKNIFYPGNVANRNNVAH